MALEMGAKDRDVGVYKERRDGSRALREIQILGVQLLTPYDRKVLLGHSHVPGPYHSTYLQQCPPRWTQNASDSGFEFKSGDSSVLIQANPYANRDQQDISNGATEFNAAPPCEDQFAITWERMKGVHGAGVSPEHIPGQMRSYFPGIVVRTQRLTKSVQSIFHTRFNGRYPKEIIITGMEQ